MAALGELALIRALSERVGKAGGAVRLGIGDDCAVLRPPAGHDVLVTTDFSMEGVHFRRDWHPPQSVGHRCLARGLSDLAAMGAPAMGAFLSLALPSGFVKQAAGRRWLDGFQEGLLALSKRSGAPLTGGDTATAPGEAILADIVLIGSAPRGTELRRSGAKPGHGLYVTGALGGSAAELAELARYPRKYRELTDGPGHPHLFPAPRLAVGERLRRAGIASACIDLSDGLSTDLRHICEASGLGAIVDAAAIPLHDLLAGEAPDDALRQALHGGEDYELLFTAAPEARVPKRIAGVPVTRIGTMTRGSEVLLERDGRQQPLERGGWEHGL